MTGHIQRVKNLIWTERERWKDEKSYLGTTPEKTKENLVDLTHSKKKKKKKRWLNLIRNSCGSSVLSKMCFKTLIEPKVLLSYSISSMYNTSCLLPYHTCSKYDITFIMQHASQIHYGYFLTSFPEADLVVRVAGP